MMARLRRLQSDEGFTLIELLIVIVILGILSAVVVFAVGGVSNKGTLSACQADKSSVASAAEAMYAQTSAYPATLQALVTGGFLHQVPSTTNGYTITLGTSGTVTSGLAQC
jgi:prepilin-type N-terminal cleavage/methylation domain-containing protein